MSKFSRSSHPRHAAAAAAAAILLLGLATAQADKPSPEVKRLLFPAQGALATDSLDLAIREANKALASDPKVTQTHLILGEAYWRKGDLVHAKAEYEKAHQLGDAEADAQAGLALVALAQDNLAAAETAARAAVGADKRSWMANYAMGRILLAKGSKEEAFKYLSNGKGTKDRSDGRDLFEAGMGLSALADKDASGAESNLIRARALAPNTIEHVMNLAAMYETTNQWSQAGNVLQAAQEKAGSSPQLSFRLGRAFENQQQWNDALRQYQKALQADSTYAPAMASLGHLLLLDRSKTAAAVQVLTRAVALRPTPASKLDLGIALTRANKPAEAVPLLEAVQADDPSPEAKLALGRAYAATDAVDKALKLYTDPDVNLIATGADLLQLGTALTKAKDYEGARKYLNLALERDPKQTDAYARLGLVELVNKNYDAALANFQKKLDADPKSAFALMNMGITYQQMGKTGEALATYRRATQAAPGSAQAWVQLGQALPADSAAAAQKAFGKALAIDPQNVAAKRGMGFTYLVQEKYTQAISQLKEATQAAPDDAQGWVWLGQAQLNSGNRGEASQSFDRALKLDPGNKAAQEGKMLLSGAAKK